MQFIILALATLAAAAPGLQKRQTSSACSSDETAQCCQTDVEGILDLTCSSPTGGDDLNLTAFEADCADQGLTATCCTLSLAGLCVLSTTP